MCDFLQEKQLKNLCNAFIKPFTKYDVLAWGGAPKTHLIKIERSLNKAVRIILFKGKGVNMLRSKHRFCLCHF